MAFKIPLTAVPSQRFNIVLPGDNGRQNCTIYLYQRLGQLYMDLAVDQEVIFSGRICLTGVPLKPYRSEPFDGQLVFLDLEGDTGPDYTGLGTRYQLIYLTEEEFNG